MSIASAKFEKLNKRLEFEASSAVFYLKYLGLNYSKFYNILTDIIIEMLEKGWITEDYLYNISPDDTTEFLDELILNNFAELPENYVKEIYERLGLRWGEMEDKGIVELNHHLFQTDILSTFFLFFESIVSLKTAFSPYIIATDKDKLFNYKARYLKKPFVNQLTLTKSLILSYMDLFLTDVDYSEIGKQLDKIFEFFEEENTFELVTNLDYAKLYLDVFRKVYPEYGLDRKKIDKRIDEIKKEITKFKVKEKRHQTNPQKYQITDEEIEQFKKNKTDYINLILYIQILSFIDKKGLDTTFLNTHIDYIDERITLLNRLPKVDLDKFLDNINIFGEIFSILQLLFGFPNIDFLVMLLDYVDKIADDELKDIIKDIDEYFMGIFRDVPIHNTYVVYNKFVEEISKLKEELQQNKDKAKPGKMFDTQVKTLIKKLQYITDVKKLEKDSKGEINENNYNTFKQFVYQSGIFSEILQESFKVLLENREIEEKNKERENKGLKPLPKKTPPLTYVTEEFMENSVVLKNKPLFIKELFEYTKDVKTIEKMIAGYIDKEIDDRMQKIQEEQLLTERQFIEIRDKLRVEVLETIVEDIENIIKYLDKQEIEGEFDRYREYKEVLENSDQKHIVERRIAESVKMMLGIGDSVYEFFRFLVEYLDKITIQDLYLVYLFFSFTKNEPISIDDDKNGGGKYIAIEYDDVVYFLIDKPSLAIFTDLEILKKEGLYKGKKHIFFLTNFEFRSDFYKYFLRTTKIPGNVSYYMKELMKYAMYKGPENLSDIEFYGLHSEQTGYCLIKTTAGWKVVEWKLPGGYYSPFLPYSAIENMLKDIMEMGGEITDEENTDTSVTIGGDDNRTNVWKNSFSIKGTIRKGEKPGLDHKYEPKSFRLTARVIKKNKKAFTLYDAYSYDDAEIFTELVYQDKGLFIISAPTGQGKTTALNNLVDNVIEKKVERENLFAHTFEINDTIENRNLNLVQIQTSLEKIKYRAQHFLKRSNPEYVIFGEIRDGTFLGTLLSIAKTFSTLTTMHSGDVVSAVAVLKDMGQEAGIGLGEIIEYVKALVSQRIYEIVKNEFYTQKFVDKVYNDWKNYETLRQKLIKELELKFLEGKGEYVEFTKEEKIMPLMEIRSKLLAKEEEVINQFELQGDSAEEARKKWFKIAKLFYSFPLVTSKYMVDANKGKTVAYEYLTNSQIKRVIAGPQKNMDFSKVVNIDYKYSLENVYTPKEEQMIVDLFTLKSPISIMDNISKDTMGYVILKLEKNGFFNNIEDIIKQRITGLLPDFTAIKKRYRL